MLDAYHFYILFSLLLDQVGYIYIYIYMLYVLFCSVGCSLDKLHFDFLLSFQC